jgi:hypothetical protein
MAKRHTISVSEDNKNRLRNIAIEDVSFNQIIEYLLDIYENVQEDWPNIYEYLDMDVI